MLMTLVSRVDREDFGDSYHKGIVSLMNVGQLINISA